MDPVPNELPGVFVGLEGVLPGALFLETPKESLNDAVLLGHGRRGEFVLHMEDLDRPDDIDDSEREAQPNYRQII